MPLVHRGSEQPLPFMIFKASILFVCTVSFWGCRVCFFYRSCPCHILSISFLVQFCSFVLFNFSCNFTSLKKYFPVTRDQNYFKRGCTISLYSVVMILPQLSINLSLVSLLPHLAYRRFSSFMDIVATDLSLLYSQNAENTHWLPYMRRL